MSVETRPVQVPTREARQRFDDDGLIVVDDLCSMQLVDSVLVDAESLYGDAFDEGPEVLRDGLLFTRHPGGTERYHWHRVMDAWKAKASIRDLALAPKVMALTEGLFGRKPMPFQTLNFPMGTEQPPHLDAFFFNSDPPGYMCGVWFALEDMDMDNGPLVYYPGSHKLPVPDWDEIERVTGEHIDRAEFDDVTEFTAARGAVFTAYARNVIEEHGFQPRYATIKKGQAAIWAPNIMHGGAPQRDKSRTRHSQVTHYYFEGCRHYTPLRTEGRHLFWRYPEWVREPVPEETREALRDVVVSNLPPQCAVLVASSLGNEDLLELGDRRAWPFPSDENGNSLALDALDGPETVAQLEGLRRAGAEYVVFPKAQLWWLEYRAPELQQHLEENYPAVLRDGSYCAIYALGPTG